VSTPLALACLATCLLQLPLEGQPDVRYTVMREFVSPVNGEAFRAPVLKDELPVVNWDYDRCPHPPINTLAYALVIDPASGYVAHPDEFNLETTWDAPALTDVLGQPRFGRLAPEGLPWAGAYPWEKFENAALMSAAREDPAHFTGNWWLLAAWSVRLDVISGHNEFDDEVEGLFARLPQRGPDLGDILTPYELQLAVYWEEVRDTGQLPDLDNADFGLALAWLYRSRGELIEAEYWLRTATLDNRDLAAQSSLYQYLRSSIELERSYLKSAKTWFNQAWLDAHVPTQQESSVAFILGELNRRLGDRPAALAWYDSAKERSLGMVNTDLIDHVRKLAGGNAGNEE